MIIGTFNEGDIFFYNGINNGRATFLREDIGEWIGALGGSAGPEGFVCFQ